MLQQELIGNSAQQSLSQSRQGIFQDREGIGLEENPLKRALQKQVKAIVAALKGFEEGNTGNSVSGVK